MHMQMPEVKCSLLVSRHTLFLIAILLLFAQSSFAQTIDSTDTEAKNEPIIVKNFPDSIFKFNTKKPNPKRAGLYSACIPGLGQIYNKQYWKAGLVYVGEAVAIGFTISNYNDYTKYRKAYIGMIDNNPETPDTLGKYTVSDVKLLRDGYRKYLEYSVLAVSVGYMLNILDAFIAAHLKGFDMSKDISFRASPYLNTQKQMGLQLSVCLH